MRRGKVHMYGIAEYRNVGTIVASDGAYWRIEDDEGRAFYAQTPGPGANAVDMEIGDRVEFEPLFQSTAASSASNRLWQIVRKANRQS
jgi:hypothetical protein